MRVRIRRRGGFAGNVVLGAVLDTADLPAGSAQRLETALAALPWGAPGAPPPHPDAFRYELSLPDDAGRGTAVIGEQEADDDALSPLLDRLRSAGTLE